VNLPALGAALAATVLVVAHGGVGHGWHRAQLRDHAFKPTRIVGDAAAAHRFFQVTWHIVTIVFALTAVAFYAVAFGAVVDPRVLQLVSVGYGLILALCLAHFGRTPRALLKPIPSIAGAGMVALVVLAWFAA
jgi:hypothetical protein